MTESEALITAARQYCMDNFSYWSDKYLNERTGDGHSYTDNDYHLFSRYNALSAIQEGIEYYTGQEFQEMETCKQALKAMGKESQSPFTQKPDSTIAQKAIQEERDKFVQFIETIDASALQTVNPLPYKRRLKEEERAEIRHVLSDKWKVVGYWVPLIEGRSEQSVLYFAKECFTEVDQKQVSNFIQRMAEGRLYEITERQFDYEIDQSEFDLDCYETFFCDKTFDWLVYGSHEGTIAFGGQLLVDFIRQLFVDRQDLINQW